MKEFNLEKTQPVVEKIMWYLLISMSALLTVALAEQLLVETNIFSWVLGFNIVFLMLIVFINFILVMIQLYKFIANLVEQITKQHNENETR